jgi:hypothetical protein
MHELMIASKPYIIAMLPDSGTERNPSAFEVRLTEMSIQAFVDQAKIATADEALQVFTDAVYAGKIPGATPQIPREVLLSTVASIKKDLPDVWGRAAKQFGLQP